MAAGESGAPWAAGAVGGTAASRNLGSAPSPGLISAQNAQIEGAQAARIQAAATKLNQEIYVVGSRAMPRSVRPIGANSDWDYVLPGANSKTIAAARRMLPRGAGGGEMTQRYPGGSGQDFSRGNVDPGRYHVRFQP